VKILQSIISKIGRGVAWLVLVMVLLIFLVVVQRYVFNAGSIALQESVTYLHALVFMLAAAWTLSEDGHVRVDIFYREASPRRKAWVNLLGSLVFLLPFALFMLLGSWDYVSASWAVHEGSREAGGLPLVWVLKSLIPLFALLLLLQGLLLVLKSFTQIRSPVG
jgi:TRAP-type mannitol/chloroaromatic compound transport system permease small subunit